MGAGTTLSFSHALQVLQATPAPDMHSLCHDSSFPQIQGGPGQVYFEAPRIKAYHRYGNVVVGCLKAQQQHVTGDTCNIAVVVLLLKPEASTHSHVNQQTRVLHPTQATHERSGVHTGPGQLAEHCNPQWAKWPEPQCTTTQQQVAWSQTSPPALGELARTTIARNQVRSALPGESIKQHRRCDSATSSRCCTTFVHC